MYYSIIIGSVLGIVYTFLFLPKHEGGAAGSKKLTLYPLLYEAKIAIPFSKDEILHIHHWIIYLVLLIFIPNYIFFGFAATMVVQGLTYRDCFDFIEKRPIGY